MSSRRENILTTALLTVVAAGGIGAYELGASQNDGTQREVMEAEGNLQQQELGYVALAGAGCEGDVLHTLLAVNAINTPASETLTTEALDVVCDEAESHVSLSKAAVTQFKNVRAARNGVHNAKDAASFTTDEKLTDVLAGSVAPMVGIIAFYSIAGGLKDRLGKRRSSKKSGQGQQSDTVVLGAYTKRVMQ